LPNVELRVLPLQSETSLKADSFIVLGFGSEQQTGKLGDVVSTEGMEQYLYIEGEADTYIFQLFFREFVTASLSPDDSRNLIVETARRLWQSR